MNETLFDQLYTLTTPHLADGCQKANVPIRCAPAGLQPLARPMRCTGRARPVRHVGSIDIFLEALQRAAPGEVLVIDNGGRLDEACVGDIGFPLFSLGALPSGPQRLNVRPADIFSRAMVGAHVIASGDIVAADENGVLFLPEDRLDGIVAAAVACRETEARQLEAMRTGRSYRSLVRFSDYLSRRDRDASYGFRQHLKDIEAAGEV